MSDNPSAIRLNANQRRHYEVLFARLEESLAKVESLIVDHGLAEHTLSVTVDDIPPAFRITAPPLIDQLRREIEQLSGTLGLRPGRVSRRRTISAILIAEAVRFEDSLASQMRGYGLVDSSVIQHLDPRLEYIARTLNVLASSLKVTHTRSTE
jgi:hypothetical protein